MRLATLLGCCGAIVFLILAAAAPGALADPPYLPWVSLLPTLAAPASPTPTSPCRTGNPACVDRTIDTMTRMTDRLASSCSHDAVFALTYLRVTQAYAETVGSDPTFFADTPFVNNEDAFFARQYFDAFRDWYGGDPAQVPPAWQVAFEAADEHEVNGTGDLLLGINAHVNRDLPFVLVDLGLFDADGSSRKPDHDKVNVILNHVQGPIVAEIAERFDPTVLDPNDPTGLSQTSLFQLLEAWREEAWRNAERLADAQTPAQRATVAFSIERAAAAEGQAIVASSAYRAPVTTSAGRDAYCATHWNDTSAEGGE
jgi:hypothetical protein